MTYRVVQVTDDQLEATADATGAVSVVSTAAFAGAPQAVAQVSKKQVMFILIHSVIEQYRVFQG